MSNDQIIRNTKPHEVTIPEGSNNAQSIRNKVGQRVIEEEKDDKVTADKHYSDRNIHGESDIIADQHEGGEQSLDDGGNRVSIGPEDQHDPERIKFSDTDSSAEHRVAVESSPDSDHQVMLDMQMPASSEPVMLPASDTQDSHPTHATLPPEHGSTENRVAIHSNSSDGNHALLPDAAQSVHRATLEEEPVDSHSPAIEGATSSQPVSIPTDSLHDSFATTPDMTNTESSSVKVDGHGITDSDRVIVDSSPEVLNTVPVPHAEPQVSDTPPVPQEPHLAAAAIGLSPADSAPKHTSPAQVTATLADKKAEEFRGRVDKLRDEVDQLNHRLDEFKK